MNTFKICVELDSELSTEQEELLIPYYKRGTKVYTDAVTMQGNTIIVRGNRSKIQKEDTLKSSRSTLFRSLAKPLLYAHYVYGSFRIRTVKLWVNDLEFTPTVDTETFALEPVLQEAKISKAALRKALETYASSDTALIALSNITMSRGMPRYQFDHMWRAFNALLRNKYWETQFDNEKLRKLRKDIEAHLNHYPRALSRAATVTADDLAARHLRLFLAQQYPARGGKKYLTTMLTSYKDHRVATALLESLGNKKKQLEKIGDYQTVVKHLNRWAKKGATVNSDIVDLLILKYAYYLRNQYFHAERYPMDFLVESENKQELEYLCPFLERLCFDMLEHL